MRNRRGAAKKASTSLLMALIIASAILVIIPFRITLAVGTTGAISPYALSAYQQLVGTHESVDSLGLFTQTSVLTNLIGNLTGFTVSIASIDFIALKALKVTVDIDQANGTLSGLQAPFGNGPTLGSNTASVTIQIRYVLLSVTITGYKLAGRSRNVYGEDSLTGLNPALIISLDRAFFDLFIDPLSRIGTYILQADMTVYQGLALLAEAATL